VNEQGLIVENDLVTPPHVAIAIGDHIHVLIADQVELPQTSLPTHATSCDDFNHHFANRTRTSDRHDLVSDIIATAATIISSDLESRALPTTMCILDPTFQGRHKVVEAVIVRELAGAAIEGGTGDGPCPIYVRRCPKGSIFGRMEPGSPPHVHVAVIMEQQG
jgi:hypothetical protein